MKRLPVTISIILLLCCYANAQSASGHDVAVAGSYTSTAFEFSFKYPKDWTVHGEATNQRILEIGRETVSESGVSSATFDAAMKHTYQLLTVFRYPIGTPGVTFNPAIIVMAEGVEHAPGIKTGKDFLLNLRTLLLKAGHRALLKEPVECQFRDSQFFRDDFASETNGTPIFAAHFATIKKGYALVFMFIGANQQSVDEMAKAMETYEPVMPVRSGDAKVIGSEPKAKPK